MLWATEVQAPYFTAPNNNKVRGTLKDNPLVKLMDELKVSEEVKANILGNNAVKLFKL